MAWRSEGGPTSNTLGQTILLRLANKHEPEASQSPQRYRRATCVNCEKPMIRMWHCWLHTGHFKKEVHVCKRCYKKLLSLQHTVMNS